MRGKLYENRSLPESMRLSAYHQLYTIPTTHRSHADERHRVHVGESLEGRHC